MFFALLTLQVSNFDFPLTGLPSLSLSLSSSIEPLIEPFNPIQHTQLCFLGTTPTGVITVLLSL